MNIALDRALKSLFDKVLNTPDPVYRDPRDNECITLYLGKHAGFSIGGDPELKKMITAYAQLAVDIESSGHPRWLTVSGKTGIGKTILSQGFYKYLLSIISEEVHHKVKLNRGSRGVSFHKWHDITRSLSDKRSLALDDIEDEWVTVVDDIGSVGNEFCGEKADNLYRLLEARAKKWTLFTTNLSLNQFHQIDSRMADRFIRNGNQVVSVKADSHSSKGVM